MYGRARSLHCATSCSSNLRPEERPRLDLNAVLAADVPHRDRTSTRPAINDDRDIAPGHAPRPHPPPALRATYASVPLRGQRAIVLTQMAPSSPTAPARHRSPLPPAGPGPPQIPGLFADLVCSTGPRRVTAAAGRTRGCPVVDVLVRRAQGAGRSMTVWMIGGGASSTTRRGASRASTPRTTSLSALAESVAGPAAEPGGEREPSAAPARRRRCSGPGGTGTSTGTRSERVTPARPHRLRPEKARGAKCPGREREPRARASSLAPRAARVSRRRITPGDELGCPHELGPGQTLSPSNTAQATLLPESERGNSPLLGVCRRDKKEDDTCCRGEASGTRRVVVPSERM